MFIYTYLKVSIAFTIKLNAMCAIFCALNTSKALSQQIWMFVCLGKRKSALYKIVFFHYFVLIVVVFCFFFIFPVDNQRTLKHLSVQQNSFKLYSIFIGISYCGRKKEKNIAEIFKWIVSTLIIHDIFYNIQNGNEAAKV